MQSRSLHPDRCMIPGLHSIDRGAMVTRSYQVLFITRGVHNNPNKVYQGCVQSLSHWSVLTTSGAICCAILTRTKSTTSWLVNTSQMPSQASTKNSISGVMSHSVTSGQAAKRTLSRYWEILSKIAAEIGGKTDQWQFVPQAASYHFAWIQSHPELWRELDFLETKGDKLWDREMLRKFMIPEWVRAICCQMVRRRNNARGLPLTLLNSTQPPAAMIRLVSASLLGLWSKDICFTRPRMEATALESPTLPWRKDGTEMQKKWSRWTLHQEINAAWVGIQSNCWTGEKASINCNFKG